MKRSEMVALIKDLVETFANYGGNIDDEGASQFLTELENAGMLPPPPPVSTELPPWVWEPEQASVEPE